MTTHHQGEVPERCSVGFIHTGYHGVDVQVASVSGYLPCSENNSASFLGTKDKHQHGAPQPTPAQDAVARAQEVEAQRLDACARRVVWDGDGTCGNDCIGGKEGSGNKSKCAVLNSRREIRRRVGS